MNKKYHLDKNWEFSLRAGAKNNFIKPNKWQEAIVPGTVYHNLINNNVIPDPFAEDNELRLQWVAGSDWSYRTSFKLPEGLDTEKNINIVFEGLDTAAEIFLNGNSIGKSENMFLEYRFNISEYLQKKNMLEVRFTSPYRYARELEQMHGKLPVALASERVYIRKAQYSFRWDWGPSFADMGIWKNVYLLQQENINIKSITCNTKYIQQESAGIELDISLSSQPEPGTKLLINVSDDSKSFDYEVKVESQTINKTIVVLNPVLWWPNGEGEQHLYKMKVSLVKDVILDEVEKIIGIRTIELQQEDDGKNTFRFIVNGRKIFAKGANWIPADSFLTRADEARYRTLLTYAKEANMNIVRVWGGGIYEQDFFYSLCDELGLLVWQDFMFACASYPEYQDFLENVKLEIEQNVTRLQYHPCIAIWCGNNENEWIWYQEQKRTYRDMPGCSIYSNLIPSILKRLDPSRPYWESSPFNSSANSTGDDDPNSQASGNRHQWDLWSRWIDYKMVVQDNSLFVTEFGFQGPANQSTFEKVIPAQERDPQSYLFEFHNKQVEGNERQFKFLAGHLPVRTSWKDFIYLAQLSQGLALKTCLEHWRLNYTETNGSIIWQLNDCWPVSSWSLIDSDLKPKLSYFLVRQSFRPQSVVVKSAGNQFEIYHLNGSNTEFKGHIEVSLVPLDSSKVKSPVKVKVLNKDYKTKVFTLPATEEIKKGKIIITAALYNEKGVLLHRAVHNESEWKYLKLPDARIKVKLLREDKKYSLSLRSDKPAFFVTLYGEGLLLENNCITLLPGEEIFLPLKNIAKPNLSAIKLFSLNNYLE